MHKLGVNNRETVIILSDEADDAYLYIVPERQGAAADEAWLADRRVAAIRHASSIADLAGLIPMAFSVGAGGMAVVCASETETAIRAAALDLPRRVLSLPASSAITVLRLGRPEAEAICAALRGCALNPV